MILKADFLATVVIPIVIHSKFDFTIILRYSQLVMYLTSARQSSDFIFNKVKYGCEVNEDLVYIYSMQS